MNNKIDWPKWPRYSKDAEIAVMRVIKSNQLFAADEVNNFERSFGKYIGTQYAVGVGNATQGLHLALAALDIGLGHEVIVTPYSWISSASCILMQNAIPVFVDIEAKSFGIDPKSLESKISTRTRAIIVVHMFGYPCEIEEISKIAKKHNIPIIEDASHAFGAKVHERNIGKFGLISVYSLHQRKSLSVGDGGVICTDDPKIFDSLHRLRSFGHEELSYNYRMTEFAGALGHLGLQTLDEENEKRRDNFKLLLEGTRNEDLPISILEPRQFDMAVFHAVLFTVDKPMQNLDEKLKILQEIGVPIRKTWSPLHLHSHFNAIGRFPARGLPWEFEGYDGQMKGVSYAELELPVVVDFCPNRLLELYVHPPAGIKEMEFFISKVKEVF